MDSDKTSEVAHDFPGFFKVYKDGRVERYDMSRATLRDPPAKHLVTDVQTKEVVISSETGVKACMFLPKIDKTGQKLPLLVHYHGGAFCVGSPFHEVFQGFLKAIVNLAGVVAISIEYRLAPEHPLPTAHEDSFEALKWISGHSGGKGPESWINEHVDLDRIFLIGESAGGNLAHYVAVKAGTTHLPGLKLAGSIIVHPYFGGKDPDRVIMYMYPNSSGTESDPLLSAAADPNLGKMAVGRVLVCLGEKDFLRERGATYYKTLCGGAWKGKVELFESEGEGHCSFFFKNNEKTQELFKRIADFIKLET